MEDIKAFEPLWGEWRSVDLLGQGAYGRVYKMVKRDLDKEYYAAVKHLSLPSEPGEVRNLYTEGYVSDQKTLKAYYDDVLKSLCTEIDLCYKLKGNTNIVSYEDHIIRQKTTDIGYDIFIKMELLTNLQDRINEGGLTVQDVVKLGEDICKALVVMRREKIVHRDIKPGNIFINSGGDYKLGDFGVSKSMERTVSSMSVKGTFNYMAPEVVRGSSGDYRVDIYSLGIVLYRQLNKNRGPFLPLPPEMATQEIAMRAQERRLNGEALPPPADADEELSRIVLKACAYLPEDRWESAEEMGKALAEYRLRMNQAEPTKPRDVGMAGGNVEPMPTHEPLGDDPTELMPRSDGRTVPQQDDPNTVKPSPAADPALTIYIRPDIQGSQEDAKTEGGELPGPEGGTAPQQDDPNTASPSPAADSTLTTHILPDIKKYQEDAKTEGMKPPKPERKAAPEQGAPKTAETAPPADSPPAPDTLSGNKKNQDPAKPEGMKLPNIAGIIKAKPYIAAAAAAAVILIGIIGASTMADRSTASSATSSVAPEPVASNSEAPPETDGLEPVVWLDSTIRDGVLDAMGVGGEDLTQEMLEGLEELCIPAPDPESGESLPISTWADLSLLTGLKTLEVNGRTVEEFTFPADMPELETLKLIGCGCTSIEFLTQPGFQGLRVLNLSGNEITDLAPIAGLAELTRLDISQNPVTSLASLSGLSSLSDLWASDVQVEDWSPVEHIAHVTGRPDTVSAQPDETQTPEPTPASTQKPAATPKPDPTPRPTQAPRPTPTPRPAPTPRPTPRPTTRPEPTPVPATPTPAPPTPAVIPVSSVSVYPYETLLNEGGGIRLSVSISPSNATNQRVSWSSSNPAVAVVDGSGYVSAVGRGTARITATCDGKSGSCTITVD